mmetsp:Transcript_11098/g.21673  ORF Transcript_11098/g.21673 Transcript_11098/m.21673 type:complete len:542 (-) Transcript_11098:125-1750(-)
MHQGMAGRYSSAGSSGSGNGGAPGQQQQQQQSGGMVSMHSQDGMGGYGLSRSISHDSPNLGSAGGSNPGLMQTRSTPGPYSSGSNGSAPFDMSDFPALAQNRSGPGTSQVGDLSGGSYAMHIAQQDRSQHQSDFAMQNEDFPALGGATSDANSSSPNMGPRPGDAPNGRPSQVQGQYYQGTASASSTQASQQPQQASARSVPAGFQAAPQHQQQQQQQQQQHQHSSQQGTPQAVTSSSQQSQQSQQTSAASQPPSSAAPGAGKRPNGAPPPGVLGNFDANGYSAPGGSNSSSGLSSLGGVADPSKVSVQQQPMKKAPGGAKKRLPPEQHYGLLGLLSVIRMEDADRGTLALGTDLTTLGLNLNSSESLHTSFSSPWSDRQSTRDPPYQLPACYNSAGATGGSGSGGQRQAPKHFSKYQLETLFYIFYGMPRDKAQVQAAQELYKRKWHYHTEHKVWFIESKEMAKPPAHQLPPDVPQYVYFDIQSWEPRLFTNASVASTLSAGFMASQAMFAIGNPQAQQQQQQQQIAQQQQATPQAQASS